MEISPAQPVLRFGPYEADLRAGVLRKDGTKIRVQEKPLQVLAALAARQGELVTRAELHKRLWPNETFVDFEDGLNTAVKKLRLALSDDAEEPRYIETIPRRGYRFLVPAEFIAGGNGAAQNPVQAALPAEAIVHPPFAFPAENASQAAPPPEVPFPTQRTWHRYALAAVVVMLAGAGAFIASRLGRRQQSQQSVSAPIRSLAILPFRNLSGDPHQDYFAEGITDELATELAQIPSLRVTSSGSVSQLSGDSLQISSIRRELGVDAVVEGSVVRDGDTVRLDARLITTSNGRTLWARRFESETQGVVGTEDNLVRSIAERVQAVLRPDQRTQFGNAEPVGNEAYEAYLHGLFLMHHRTIPDLRKSPDYFSEATRLDPNFAAAYAQLAHSYSLLADYGVLPDRLEEPKAEMAARRALQLDGSLGPAHSALAFVLWHYDWKWNAAGAEFQRALQLDPNDATAHHWYALFLASKGDFTDAEREIHQARVLDPLSSIIRTNEGWIRYYQGDFAGAVKDYQQVLQVEPSFLPAEEKLWMAYAVQGNSPAALKEISVTLAELQKLGNLAQLQNMNRSPRFRQIAEEYANSSYCNAYEKARVFSLLGRKNEALRHLSDAEQERQGWMVYIGVDPAFAPLRASPQFQRLLADVGAPRQAAPR